jgi:hypothetical protein
MGVLANERSEFGFGGIRNVECPQIHRIRFSLSSPLSLLPTFKVGDKVGDKVGESPTFILRKNVICQSFLSNSIAQRYIWYITDIMLNRYNIVVGLIGLTL